MTAEELYNRLHDGFAASDAVCDHPLDENRMLFKIGQVTVEVRQASRIVKKIGRRPHIYEVLGMAERVAVRIDIPYARFLWCGRKPSPTTIIKLKLML